LVDFTSSLERRMKSKSNRWQHGSIHCSRGAVRRALRSLLTAAPLPLVLDQAAACCLAPNVIPYFSIQQQHYVITA
jgi:hypothetical protein